MTRTSLSPRMMQPFLIGLLALAPLGFACAAQPGAPPPSVQFQQTVQQQQVSGQLQQSQLQQQLHQSVSDNAKRPSASNPNAQRQLGQADQAQRDRDRATQQAAVDRYRDQAALPRVIPQGAPASSRSGG